MYQIENPMNKAFEGMGQASNSFSNMTKDTGQEDPGPTVGGAVMTGISGAVGGATLGSSLMSGTTTGATAGGWWGAGIGAVLGIASYLLS